jgi:hypothetical protein
VLASQGAKMFTTQKAQNEKYLIFTSSLCIIPEKKKSNKFGAAEYNKNQKNTVKSREGEK